jgi:hypothetical protein
VLIAEATWQAAGAEVGYRGCTSSSTGSESGEGIAPRAVPVGVALA